MVPTDADYVNFETEGYALPVTFYVQARRATGHPMRWYEGLAVFTLFVFLGLVTVVGLVSSIIKVVDAFQGSGPSYFC